MEIGDPQVRNCGTIGGSIVHADPAADYPAALMALDAEIVIEGPDGERTVAVDRFFTGLMATDLQESELVTAVSVPVIASGTSTAYRKLRHPASGFAIAGAAAVVSLDGAGRCTRVALALTGVGPRAFRLSGVEQAMAGKSPSARNIRSACQGAAAGIDVQGDVYASADYRAAMADVFAGRALAAAAGIDL
jgi:carbon-monoxide dehydrogenase medium subunit